VIPQNDRRGADAKIPRLAALKVARNLVQVRKKWPRERIKFFARGRQNERAPLKQRHPQEFLQLRHLRAHGGLLDPVRNVADRRHDAAVLGNIIKKLEVMNVH